MAASTLIQIADAVAASLNAAAFSAAFTAVRSYQPEYTPADLATLRVSVVPEAVESERASRTLFQEDFRVNVLVQKRPSPLTDAALDALTGLVEEIGDYLKTATFGGLPMVHCVGVTNQPAYAPDRLAEFREFCSLLVVTYRTWR